ncbi:OFA family MFS transporter [Coraliomargarita sp. SDUM461004]|uniref:OFA family MFS transporter n=1 Tax=Thalassobacterium sedimentorum TaxID=3041258 RepID=A0ABU1AH87_9BACT|nr:OFA family MFS transporter [Coraliomargarita sp. SDUM461004]MDQ8192998.1 OFA family MFS transporter [Coraliomargarita sp. SDUM461004]
MKTKNRWLIAASACSINLSIGSIYAYSVWKMPLENTFGWSSSNTSLAFSLAIFFLGLSAAFLGSFIQRKGARFGGLLSAAFFSGGLLGSALACQVESLPLFYLSFGAVSGIGLGLGYISPIATLVKWFPDRRGLATGLAIMGFGFGGLVCAKLIDQFVPVQAEISLPQGISAYEYQQQATDAVTATATSPYAAALAATPEPELAPQKTLLYQKASIVRAFSYLAGIYLVIMVPSALYITPPTRDDLQTLPSKETSPQTKSQGEELTVTQALKRPAFYGLWSMLFINASCGIALISTAKKMGYEMVHLSDSEASLLVMGISLFNGLGRIGWAALSDYIGRPNTFVAFFLLQIAAFPLLAKLTHFPILFMGITFIILSCYGGGFATIPTYISDLFGIRAMPTLLGMILTAWSCAGLVGPMVNARVYEATQSYQTSLYVFGAALVGALIISLLMKLKIPELKQPHIPTAGHLSRSP